jgi:S-adenosylmethionine:tRNA ribosyltransferase-isomerase
MQVPIASESPSAPSMLLSDFDFELPAELIAQTPAAERDGSRLLTLGRRDGAIGHGAITDLPSRLRAGDLLVFNDTRVRPARLFGRLDTGGAVELLLVRACRPGEWECLGRPAKRLRPGTAVRLAAGADAVVRERAGAGRYVVGFDPTVDVEALLAAHGEVPLPPYIRRPDGPLPLDGERYQTVFARRPGAVAAPTAGLHFSPALLAALAAARVGCAYVTLDVGPATFLPWRDDQPDAVLEGEWAEIPAATVAAISATRAAGGRVVAVGTTTTRALESAARRPGGLASGGFWADAFVQPGFEFAVLDGLVTNFHLPRSTLLMLVSAFAGRQAVLAAYAAAVRERYRFYSYGDAMLIV